MMTKCVQVQVSEMFNAISPTYDRVNRILSLGIDQKWRNKLKSYLPKKEKLHLLDLATGTCDQLLELMRCKKIEYALGIDLAEEMLKVGQKKVDSSEFRQKIELKVANALEIPAEEEEFDCVTISFGIRNVENPSKCLKEMHRVLAPGGRALILEFSQPQNRLVRGLHLIYLRHLLPRIGGVLSGKKSAYGYLNQTIEAFPYGETFCSLMKEVGFEKVDAHPLTFGVATLYVGEKGE